MHIIILNQTFYPDTAATAQHMWDLALSLVAKGHRVTALASRNVYGSSERAFAAREVVQGVEIVRVGGTAYGKKSLVRRVADFASFYLASAFEMRRMSAPDVVVALTSPPMISTLASFFCRWRRKPDRSHPRFVYYVMDLYPEAAVASGVFRKRGFPDRLFSWFTGRALAHADAIVALGDDMRELLQSHYPGRCGDRIHVIPPWADGDELRPIPRDQNPMRRELGIAETFNIVYSGNLGIAHDLDTMLRAIEMTRDDSSLAWVFIGAGRRLEQLKTEAADKGWKHVKILPYQDRVRLNESLNVADVHLVSQLPAFTGIVVPSKLFGIMAVGKPSLLVGPADCECARIIQAHSAGMVIRNGDSASLVESLRQLQQGKHLELGNNARQAFLASFDQKIACDRLERLITQAGQGA